MTFLEWMQTQSPLISAASAAHMQRAWDAATKVEREACGLLAQQSADQRGLADLSRCVAENIAEAIRARGGQ